MTSFNPTLAESHFLSSIPHSLPLDNAFWQFSLQIWKDKACKSALLALQEEEQWAINPLLFACWCGLQHTDTHQLSPELLDQAAVWQQQWVTPLRAQRRPLQASIAWQNTLRQQLLQSELMAEQIEQALLFLAFTESSSSEKKSASTIKCIVSNLLNCIQSSGSERPLRTMARYNLKILIKTCLPNHEDQRLEDDLNQLNPLN